MASSLVCVSPTRLGIILTLLTFGGCNPPPPQNGAGSAPPKVVAAGISPATNPTVWPSGEQGFRLIERDLDSDSDHYVGLALEAGEYLELDIEQLGVDLIVTLTEPGASRPSLLVDSPNGRTGSETLFWWAKVAGEHTITISTAKGSGGYIGEVRALRPATPQDKARALGAEAVHNARQSESLNRSIGWYRIAAENWQEAREVGRRASALYQIGKALFRHRNSSDLEALTSLREASELFRDSGDTRREALALDLLGHIYLKRGELGSASAVYLQSLEIWRTLQDTKAQASLLNNLGLVAKRQGKIQKALVFYSDALAFWRILGHQRDQAVTLSNLGILYSMQGEHQRALDLQREAGELVDLLADPNQGAAILTKLGDALLELNREEEALDHYQRALGFRRQIGDLRGEAVTLNSMGWAYRRLGQLRVAKSSFHSASRVFRRLKDSRALATVLNNLANLYEVSERLDEASSHFQRAFELAVSSGHKNAMAVALLGQARVDSQHERWESAQKKAEWAIEIFESIYVSEEPRDLKSSYFASKQRHYEFLIEVLAKRHRLEPALGFDNRVFQIGERARARALLDTLRAPISKIVSESDDPDLEIFSELQTQVSELHIQQRIRVHQGAPKEELKKLEREIRARLESLRRHEARLQGKLPSWKALLKPKIPTLYQVQRELLDSNTLLLEYFWGEKNFYILAVSRDESSLIEVPGRLDLENAALRAHSTLSRSHLQARDLASRLAAENLSRILLGPVQEQLRKLERGRIVFVVPGVLQYVPFAALPNPQTGASMIEAFEIVGLPSISVLPVLRQQSASRSPKRRMAAVLADPVFSPEDERLRAISVEATQAVDPSLFPRRLPHSRREAEALLGMIDGAQVSVALGFEASREIVISGGLADYQILHFGTHGILDTKNPELSALVLSLWTPDGKKVDGYLRSYDVAQLDLVADLVVLSACRTALGQNVQGEGLVGLTRAFMHAGATRVLVSLWDIDDEATAELMTRFYHYLLADRLPPGRALQKAQAWVREQPQWRAPYYWSGFVLQGDWYPF